MYAWQVSNMTVKFGWSTLYAMRTTSLGLLKRKPGSNSQTNLTPLFAHSSADSFHRWAAVEKQVS